jgi:hypothetical protein
MEQAIRGLLKLDGGSVNPKHASVQGNNVPVSPNQSPETYFGLAEADDFDNAQPLNSGRMTFTPTGDLPASAWTLGGTWNVGDESITAVSNATLYMNFAAKNVYTVGGAPKPTNITVLINGVPVSQAGDAGGDVHNSQVTMSIPTLYRIVSLPTFSSNDTIELEVPAGVSLNTFTFGS